MMSLLKKYHKDADYSYTLGMYPSLELFKYRPGIISEIIIGSKLEDNAARQKLLVSPLSKKVRLDDKLLKRLSPKKNIYIISVFKKYESKLSYTQNHLLLVNPSDAGNLGTILRAMAAFKIGNLAIIKPAVDIWDPKVVRASMGAIFQINFSYFENFADYRAKFPQHNLYAFMTDGATEISQTDFREHATLIFGNEATGLPPEFKEMAQSVSIKQSDKVDSLNLANSVAIGLYVLSLKH